MKNTARIIIVIACAFILGSPLLADAVSYPISEEHRKIAEKAIMKAGATVYLFHSGTPDVRKAIEANDTLIVYGDRHGETKEVGKIRVHSYVGEYYLKGDVIEGEIRHDDIAKKGGVSCLVILHGEMIK